MKSALFCYAVLLFVLSALGVARAEETERAFSFSPYLDLSLARTLYLSAPAIEGQKVKVTGVDTGTITKPFLFDWGDGETTSGGFPATHTYAATDRNYVVKVTAHYENGTDTASRVVRFLPSRYDFQRMDSVPLRVSIPREMVELQSTVPVYDPSKGVSCFQEEEIKPVPREAIEYILDVGHRLQMEYLHHDVLRTAIHRQVVLKQTEFGGCRTLWYSDPAAIACHPDYLAGEVGFSSLLHELAHNLTLNSPARYRFGGKTDGAMNTIVSEVLANIFQHATIHDILNTPGQHGLGEDLARGLRESGIRSMAIVREAHRKYLADPKQYTTYDDPDTDEDETFNTFMTVAYVFCEEAEKRADYRTAVMRMMRLMQTFSRSDHARFQVHANESFRATFLVAAMSHGFEEDLRPRFRKLGFPLSNRHYVKFRARMK